MTVKELRKALTKLIKEGHGDTEIIMEGCDCDAPCETVMLATDPHDYVYLGR